MDQNGEIWIEYVLGEVLGIPPQFRGFDYLKEAISILMENSDMSILQFYRQIWRRYSFSNTNNGEETRFIITYFNAWSQPDEDFLDF